MTRTIRPLAAAVRLVSRHLPIVSGHGTLVQLPPLRWVTISNEPHCWITLDSTIATKIPVDDFIGRAAFFFGDHDPKIFLTLRSVLTSDSTFVDIGANIGTVSLRCARIARRVVAVEPQRQAAELLIESALRNGMANIEVHTVALSNRNGTGTLHVRSVDNSGQTGLNPPSPIASPGAIVVREASTFLSALSLVGDYVIKLDVEGHEATIIESGLPYFRKHRPKAILFEMNSGPNSIASTPLLNSLSTLGMSVYAIQKSLLSFALVPIQSPRACGATDFIAVSSGKTSAPKDSEHPCGTTLLNSGHFT